MSGTVEKRITPLTYHICVSRAAHSKTQLHSTQTFKPMTTTTITGDRSQHGTSVTVLSAADTHSCSFAVRVGTGVGPRDHGHSESGSGKPSTRKVCGAGWRGGRGERREPWKDENGFFPSRFIVARQVSTWSKWWSWRPLPSHPLVRPSGSLFKYLVLYRSLPFTWTR